MQYMISDMEYRSNRGLEVRCPSNQPTELVGYASTFNQPYEVDGVIETISEGAFDNTLKGSPDVFALVSHDPSRVIARSKNGTLKLMSDATGLKVNIKPVNTQEGRDLVTLIETGTIDAMSFGFIVKKDDLVMRDGRVHRAITEVELHEVSCVAFPANNQAVISVRSRERANFLLHPHKKLIRRFIINPLATFQRNK